LTDKHNYLEEHLKPLTPRLAMEEASRCLLCYDAPCSESCPANTDPGKFIRSLRFRNVKGAVETIREENILGGICARVCPYEKLCEEACSRTGIDEPIQIGRLQRYATDYERAVGMQVLEAPKATKEKVAVIGSGPAGLATAAKLAQEGYKVTLFEANEKAGGVLTYGIVPTRLPQDIVDHEVKYVENLGVDFKFNTKVGEDVTLDELKKDGYQAYVVAVGLQQPKTLNVPGADLDGVTNALNFLAKAKPNNGKVAIGNDVVVMGGGDVAMDCASTAKLLGAENVTVLYRRTPEEMPAYKDEVCYVRDLGVHFDFTFTPDEFVGKDGKLAAVKGKGFYSEENYIQLKADTAIFAIGQVAEDTKNIADLKISLDGKNVIQANEETYETNLPNIFAVGDVVNGGDTVVEAVAEGKVVAQTVDKYLTSLRKEGVK